jgi:dTDP-4-dehydrorhamnose 3,5-epimerase-like enzyme
MIDPLIQLPQFVDKRGALVVAYEEKDISFIIRRVFYIYNIDPDARRGVHAHRTTQQFLICLKGQCSVVLDDGLHQQTYILNDPVHGLSVDHSIWVEIHSFSAECLLMVLCSTTYDPDDYIDDYQEFLKYRDQMRNQASEEKR